LAQKYGHVGIVTSVNPDGTFNYKDQNGSKKLAV
jgi:surface antigen